MPDVMELLEKRQGIKSNEQFANEMGLRGSTLWRYKNKKSEINTATRASMIRYFSERKDAEMVGALLAYKTGTGRLSPSDLSTLGKCFLDFAQDRLTLVPST